MFQSTHKRSGILDLLRFVAVLIVFLAHYTDTFNYTYRIVPANLKYTVFSRYATLALFVFFIISSYVVTMTSIKRSLKDFLIIRLSRIYPLFWVSCLVAFLLPRIISDNHSYLAHARLKTLLANLTMLPSFLGYPMLSPVFHTLTIELIFYFFIAFIILFHLWSRILFVITFLLGLSIANILLYITVNLAPFCIFLLPFLAGMLFYFIRVQYAKPWKLYTLLAINFGCALVCAKAWCEYLISTYKEPDSHNVWAFWGIITFIYVLFLLIALNRIQLKAHPLFQLMSDVTYPFYLFHIYFLVFYWYFSDKIQPDLLLFSILLVALVTAYFLNILVEKPLSKLTLHILVAVTNLFKKSVLKLQNISFN